MDVVQFLSAAGIGGVVGSLLTTLVQAWVSHRSYLANSNFQEKKEAYVGILDALHRSEVEKTRETALTAGHGQNRRELVGTVKIRKIIERITETNPSGGKGHPDRPQAISDLKAAMREDLGVQL